MSGRLRVAALAALLLAGAPAVAAPPDPRARYAEGNFDAAAAQFEERWRADGQPVDGVNAVVAWRAAGKYARARVLLEAVVADRRVDEPLTATVAALRERLALLTATIRLDGVHPADVTVEVDGEAASWLGDLVVVAVGRRDMVVERPGCAPFTWSDRVPAGAALVLPVALACEALHGSLHLTIERGESALLVIDGTDRHAIDGHDEEFPLAPGRHEIVVSRHGGLRLLEEIVTIAPGATVRRTVVVSGRTIAKAWFLAAGPELVPSSGPTTALLGLTFGFFDSGEDETPEGRRTGSVRWEMAMTVGMGASTADDVGSGQFYGGFAFHRSLFGPLWRGRVGGIWTTLTFDPLAIRLWRLAGTEHYHGALSAGFLPVTLTADLGYLYAALQLWPGITSHETGFEAATEYLSVALSLSIAFPFGVH